jgi:MULE transposase domain
VAYLFLSTAASIERDKRKRSLESFLNAIKTRYGMSPEFVHTDKDVAEINAMKSVWPDAKHQLCRWHMHRAVGDRCKKKKLATSKYDPKKANEAYRFISATWKPRVKPDLKDDEGDGEPAEESTSGGVEENVGLYFTTDRSGPNAIEPIRLPGRNSNVINTKPTSLSIQEPAEEQSEVEEDANDARVFCPEQHRKPLHKMMEKHANAHPLIPGDYNSTAVAIRHWAVWQAYYFCYNNGLPELWAYLWCNWYRLGRWVLWARAPCATIPVLRTTMFVEAQ